MYTVFQRVADRVSVLGAAYVGDPPDAATLPYLFVWGAFPTRRGATLARSVSTVNVALHLTCVAGSPANALKLAAQAEGLLAGWEPVVSGWHVEPITVTGSTPLQPSQQHTDPTTNRIPEAVVLSLRVRAVRVERD